MGCFRFITIILAFHFGWTGAGGSRRVGHIIGRRWPNQSKWRPFHGSLLVLSAINRFNWLRDCVHQYFRVLQPIQLPSRAFKKKENTTEKKKQKKTTKGSVREFKETNESTIVSGHPDDQE